MGILKRRPFYGGRCGGCGYEHGQAAEKRRFSDKSVRRDHGFTGYLDDDDDDKSIMG